MRIKYIGIVVVAFIAFQVGATEPPALVPDTNGKASVYLYRPRAFTGGGVKYDVAVNGSTVARLKNCSYTLLTLEPGTYTLSTQAHPSVSVNPEPIEIEAVNGQRNFYLLDITGSVSFIPIGTLVTVTSSVKVGWRKSSEADAAPLMARCTQVAAASSR